MFHVEWVQKALDELTVIWMQADSALRKAITAATHALDQQLQSDPYSQSESRDGKQRVMFASPLGIQIEIDDKQRIVWVVHVWQFRRRQA